MIATSIDRETITQIPADEAHLYIRYEWNCPQCGDKTHGDSRNDSIFEIRHDALCISCRVKNGEYRFDGSKFVRTTQPSQLSL